MVEFERRAAAGTASSRYEKWEEVYVSSDKGKREVHYYLKRINGVGLDLAVVGKEKTLRHMSYRYAFQDKGGFLQCNNSSLPKLRSRREVIDWLDSIVNPELKSQESCKAAFNYSDGVNGFIEDSNLVKKLNQSTKEFTWLGVPWTCRKRRRHYRSFCRNGVKIAVHDFVYVLAEEDERLVAHLDDMYEDSKGNKMVVVQWFHKIEEVGNDLPQNYHDREIFFSLCLQDLNIECIDGLATVLSPEHFEIYLNEATRTQLEPFVCHRQFDNDEVKRFDITRVKGYWNQDLVRCLSFGSRWKHEPVDVGQEGKTNHSDASGQRPKKRLRWSEDCETRLHSEKRSGDLMSSKAPTGISGAKEISALIPDKSALQQKNAHLSIGSQVEVLSQDSGMRGCWFRALIVKKHKEKVKVQYRDITDASDEAKNLEEWVLASRLAAPDELGIRICGRTMIRPAPFSNKRKVSWVFNVGSIVDVWRHGGWWEGIVIKKRHEDNLHVYFPGEKQESIFTFSELRHSQEWLENGWKQLKERSDLVSQLPGRETKQELADSGQYDDVKPDTAIPSRDRDLIDNLNVDEQKENEKPTESRIVRDLSKDDVLSKLKWKSSGRRRRSRSPVHKLCFSVHDKKRVEDSSKQTYERIFKIATLKVDPDNCKYPFGSSVVSSLNNLVMTR